VIVKSTLNADNNLVKIKDYKVLIIEK
jgi:hypothetical protein